MSLLGHTFLYPLLYLLICNLSIFAENAPSNAIGILQQQNSNCDQNMNTGSRPQLMDTLFNVGQSKGIQGHPSETRISLSSSQPCQTDICNQNIKVSPTLTLGSLQFTSLPDTGFCEQKSRQLQADTSNQNSILSCTSTKSPPLTVLQPVNLPSPVISTSNVASQNTFKSWPNQYSFPQTSSCQPITFHESLPSQSCKEQENKIDPVVPKCQNVALKENHVVQQQSPHCDSTQSINNNPAPQLMNTLLNLAQAKGILPNIIPMLGPLLNTQYNLQDIAQIVSNLSKDKGKVISGQLQPRGLNIATPLSQPGPTEGCNQYTNVPIVSESLPTKSSVVKEVNLMPQNVQVNKINPAVSCYNVATNPNYMIQQQLPNSNSVQNIINGPEPQLMNTLLNLAQAEGILPKVLPVLGPILNSQNNFQDIAQIVANLPKEKQKTGQSQPRAISTTSSTPSQREFQKGFSSENTIVCESLPTTSRHMQEVNLVPQNILPSKIGPVLPCTNNVAPRSITEIIPQNTVISDESLQVPLNLQIPLPPPNIPAPQIAISSPSPICGCDPSMKCACSPSSSCDCSPPCSQTGSCQTAIYNECKPPSQQVSYNPAPLVGPMLPIIIDGGRGNRDDSFEYLLPILFLALLRNGGYGGYSRNNGYGAGGSGFCGSNNCGYGNSNGCNCPFNCGCSNFPLPLPYPVPIPYYLPPDDSGESNESCEDGSGQAE